MRTRKADLQEERLGLGIGVQPPLRQPADEVIRMRLRRQVPAEGAHPLAVIVSLPIEFALLLDQTARLQSLVPFIEVVAPLQVAILVLHHITLVEAQRRLEWIAVHLADVDAVIAGRVQIPDPGMPPTVAIAHDAGDVRVIAGEEAGAGGGARGRGNVAVVEAQAFVYQPVEIGCVHIGEAERVDSVVALLVGDDEDDIGLGHGCIPGRRGNGKRVTRMWLAGNVRGELIKRTKVVGVGVKFRAESGDRME